MLADKPKKTLRKALSDYGLTLDRQAEAMLYRLIEGKSKSKLSSFKGGTTAELACDQPGNDEKMDLFKIQINEQGFRVMHRPVNRSQDDTALKTEEDQYAFFQDELHVSQLFDPAKYRESARGTRIAVLEYLKLFNFIDFIMPDEPNKALDKLYDDIQSVCMDIERERRSIMFRKFVRNIRPDFIRIMRDASTDDLNSLTWLYAGGDEEKQKYRLQAAQSYPLLLSLFQGDEDKREREELESRGNKLSMNYEQTLRDYHERFFPGYDERSLANFEGRQDMMETLRAGIEEKKERFLHEAGKREKFLDMRDDLRAAIDSALPIQDLLQSCIIQDREVSKRVLRTLGRIKKVLAGFPDFKVEKVVPFLEEIDSNWHPKTGKEFADFLECIERAMAFAEVTDSSAIEILKTSRGKWAEWKEKTVSVQAIRDIKDWQGEIQKMIILPHILSQLPEETITGLADSSRYDVEARPANLANAFNHAAMGRWVRGLAVIDPFGVVREEERDWEAERRRELFERIFGDYNDPQALKAFLGNIGLLEMLECSKRWHDQSETYSARKMALGIANLSKSQSWLPLTKPVQAPNGLWLKPLTTKQELEAEGDAMGHCVGWNHYDSKCMIGNDHIISVSVDGAEQRLSTVHLREKFNDAGNVTGLTILQEQGPEIAGMIRTGVGQDAKEAIRWYITEIFNNQELTPDWETIENVRIGKRSHNLKRGIAKRIGYDPQVEAYRVAALNAIRDYLPKKYRSLDYAELMGLSDIADALKPQNTRLGHILISEKLWSPGETDNGENHDNNGGVIAGNDNAINDNPLATQDEAMINPDGTALNYNNPLGRWLGNLFGRNPG